MEALETKAKHVPYRNSVLTFLLQNSLSESNSKTMMVVTLCPTDLTDEETWSTLKFASKARNIHLGAARRNIHSSMKNVEDQLISLKTELRDANHKNIALASVIAALKKDKKIGIDKTSSQVDEKLRYTESLRQSSETMNSQLNKSHSDLVIRFQREKEEKQNAILESEKLTRLLKKLEV
jgi:Kinesin motor domain